MHIIIKIANIKKNIEVIKIKTFYLNDKKY